MKRTHNLQVRVTRAQHDTLKDMAARRGFLSLAAYLRYVSLDADHVLHDRVAALHRHLLGAQDGDKPARRDRDARLSLEACVDGDESE